MRENLQAKRNLEAMKTEGSKSRDHRGLCWGRPSKMMDDKQRDQCAEVQEMKEEEGKTKVMMGLKSPGPCYTETHYFAYYLKKLIGKK